MAYAATWLRTATLLFAAASAGYGGSRMETAAEITALTLRKAQGFGQ